MKILRYALIGITVIVVIVIGVVAYIAATFDPNAYKPQVIQLVKEKKQRTLKLDGDIKFAVWPSLGADLGKLSLSEYKSDKEFAAVESVRVSLAVMPLLSRQLVVNEVTVKGVRADIVRFKDGRTNIDDLLAQDDQKQEQFTFDIDHVLIENAALNFRDEAKGAQYALSKVNLKIGRIAIGVPSKVEFSGAVRSNQPKLDIEGAIKTRLTFDLDRQAYTFEDLNLQVSGQAADLSNLTLKASGSISAKLKSGEYAVEKLTAAMTGASGQDKLDLKFDAPRLAFTSAKASGDKVSLVTKISGPQRSITANLGLSGIEGTAKAFSSSGMTLELDARQGDQDIKGKLASPLTGNLDAQQVSLPNLVATLAITGPGFPGKGVNAELRGSANVDGRKQGASADLAGKLADSNIKAKLSVANFQAPAITFDVDIDQLDVDRYRQPAAPAGSASGGAQKHSEQPFDLTALRNLRANGTLRIGSLKMANVKASKVKLDVGAANGRVNVNPMSASLYQGSLNGALSVDAAAATPAFAVKQNLSGINVGPLLKDFANNETLEGKGNVTLDVTGQGNTVTALKKALNGVAAVRLADGAVKGIDIAGSIRNAKAKLGTLKGEQVQQADTRQKTNFSELTATFNIRSGIARNSDLSIKSPLLRVGGEGDINIGEDSLSYLVKASIVGTTKGQGGRELDDLRGLTVPVRVTGPLAAPSYRLDFESMVTEVAKQKVEQAVRGELEKRLGGGTAKDGAAKDGAAKSGGLRDGIKGLFGR